MRRTAALVDTLAQDISQAIRVTRGRPGFSAVARLTLALGVGSVAVISGVVRQMSSEAPRTTRWFRSRLKPGVTVEEALVLVALGIHGALADTVSQQTRACPGRRRRSPIAIGDTVVRRIIGVDPVSVRLQDGLEAVRVCR